MRFELKTYKPDKKTVDKTYKANAIKLSFGTVRGFLKEIPIEEIDLTDGNQIAMILLRKWEQIVPLFTDIFPGLTEDELDTCKIDEMADVVKGVFAYMTTEINSLIGGSEKN